MRSLFYAVLGLLTCASVAFAQNTAPITLKISYQFPETHFVTVGCINPFITGVEQRVPGRVKFERYPAEQLAKGIHQLDSVRNHIADIALHNTAYTPQLTPLTTFLELPGMFGFKDTLAAQKAFWDLSQNELNKEEYSKVGVVPAWVFLSSPYQFQMAKPNAITDLSQLKGKKLRAPGAGAEMALGLIGAVGVRVSASDLYLALKRGTVDGSIISTQALPAYKLDEVLNAMSTNASFGSAPFIAAMNKDKWASLPDDIKKAIKDAGKAAGEHCARVYMDLETKENEKLRGMGKTLFELPDATLAKLNKEMEPVTGQWLKQMDQRKLPGKKIIDKFQEYLAQERKG